MNLTIIPFFLATQFAIPEIEKWKYGPEINYQLNVLSTMINEGKGDKVQMDISGDVGCRVKYEDTLLCRMSTLKYRFLDPNTNLNETGDLVIDENFELVYNENGIDKWNIDNTIDVDRLKLIRYFTAQMTTGVNINQYLGTSSSFVKKENFTIGECATAFNISWQEENNFFSKEDSKKDSSSSSDELNDVKLTLIGVPKKSGDITLVIEKFRNPKRCNNRNNYLSWLQQDNLGKSVISSFSRITVKENESFESSTVTTIKIKLRRPGILHEFAKIKLKTITEATGPLPTIPNASTRDISGGEMFENNFTD